MQLQALRAFIDLYDELGDTPTIAQVSERLGQSRNGAQGLLDELEEKGMLGRKPVTVPGPRHPTPLGRKWRSYGE